MAIEHVKDYYNKICADYKEAIAEIKDFEVECSKNLVPAERVEQLKQTLTPLLTNYEQISYIMFLLNMPKKKDKVKVYNKLNKKKIDQLVDKNNTTEAALLRNKEVLSKLKQFHAEV